VECRKNKSQPGVAFINVDEFKSIVPNLACTVAAKNDHHHDVEEPNSFQMTSLINENNSGRSALLNKKKAQWAKEKGKLSLV